MSDYFCTQFKVGCLACNILTQNVIEILKSYFARNGIPRTLIPDKDPKFGSCSLKQYLKKFDIYYLISDPSS